MGIMNYEIYMAADGFRRVNIGDDSYALEVPDGSPNQENVADRRHGDISQANSEQLRLWLEAANEVGVPLRYSWTGITNSLGHTGGHTPPWSPKPRDWRRGED